MKNVFLSFATFGLILVQGQAWLGKPIIRKTTDKQPVVYGPLIKERRTDPDMEKFRDYGFGQYIHWGVYSIPGNEWQGKINPGFSEVIYYWGDKTKLADWKNTYQNFYKEFNPTDFDAKKWAKMAKDAGIKYMVFTTKHHDGFAMWPSKYSDYTIAQSPFKRDIVKELVDAYTAEGIDVFLYFSFIDEHNKDYQAQIPITKEDRIRYENFKEYTKNQIFELVDNYPKIKGFWFDGSWDKAWINEYAWTYNLEKEIRAKHPNILIGSRTRNDEFGNRHFDVNGDLIGDFEQGWERKLPETYELLNGDDWDCVMTITYNGWGYIKDWSKQVYIKTFMDLLDMMMHSVSMDGNFVLNFGPDSKGNFRPEEIKLAKEFGDWMKVNSDAVYGTSHTDVFEKTDYGYLTQKGNTVYLTVFKRPVDDLIRLKIQQKSTLSPVQTSLLENQKKLNSKITDIGLDKDKFYYYDIAIPESYKSKKPFVLKIELKEGSVKGGKLTDAKM